MAINRSIKPIPIGEISFTLPKIQKSRLKNGLKILFVKKDDLPILQYNLVINAGSKNDPADKKGLVNLSAMMMDEGAGRFNALELNDEFETLGANFTISRNEDSVYISLQSLKENYRHALELFGLVITDPHLKEEDSQREKRKVLTRIIQLDDDPEETANSVFEKFIFGNSNPYAYPTIGYAEHIEQITNEEIKIFYQNFIRPNNAQIVVVGNTTLSKVEKDLAEIFKDWTPNNSNGFEIRDGITFEELAFAQSSIIRKFPSNFETFRQIGSNLTGKIIHSLADDYFDCYIDRIKEVTEESVKKTALELIHPDEAIIVIVADREKVADQLKGLGLGEIEEVNHRGEPITS